jgi:Mg2+/Co2+ transporter CorB
MSAFFSSSETSMMAINRYRLKHLVKEKYKPAKRVTKLLERTDRLLGVILIGNNFTHTLATAIATVIAIRVWDDSAVLAVTVLMTIIMIIFAEVMPKTIAAIKPESIAFPASYVLKPLSKILSPLVTLVSLISNNITKLLGVNAEEPIKDELSSEELKTILQSSGVPDRQLQMLVSIFDMDHLSVNDVMIPKNQLIGINISEEMTSILMILRENQYDNLPVYEETLDNLKGILTLEGAANFLIQEPAKENLINCLQELKFIPENTPLHTQLLNFQNEKRLVGTVVDEYGDIQGMITRKAILEEIVGKLTSDTKENLNILPQQNEEFIINGNTNIREVNKKLGWDLPTDGPKTISGLILETAQSIPENNVGIKILNYNFETILIKDNVVKMAKAKKIPLTEKLKEEEDE